MKANRKFGLMISSVFMFIGTLWWAIGAMVIPSPDSLLFQIVWAGMFSGVIFGIGFAILTIFVPNRIGGKYEVT
jgi:hypothetical protein